MDFDARFSTLERSRFYSWQNNLTKFVHRNVKFLNYLYISCNLFFVLLRIDNYFISHSQITVDIVRKLIHERERSVQTLDCSSQKGFIRVKKVTLWAIRPIANMTKSKVYTVCHIGYIMLTLCTIQDGTQYIIKIKYIITAWNNHRQS